MKTLHYLMLAVMVTTAAFSNRLWASKIIQCEQPDGTIEFTNQGCSKHNKPAYKKTYNKKKLTKKKTARSSNKLNIRHLQNSILKSASAVEKEKDAQAIIDTVLKAADKGQLRKACNAIASTYARLSKQLIKQQRSGTPVNPATVNIQRLFEEIMLAETTIHTASDLDKEINLAWEKYRSNNQPGIQTTDISQR